MNQRKRELQDFHFRKAQKNLLIAPLQKAKEEAALKKLLLELSHVRTCRSLDIKNEKHFHYSETLGYRILCGVSFIIYGRAKSIFHIEILHDSGTQFKLFVQVTTEAYLKKERIFDCLLRFKNLAKFLIFIIPILKEE